tara:strand:+ start:2126 stop:3379 length:1254 start_codon:yes stop_codon:yes gene_type:complete
MNNIATTLREISNNWEDYIKHCSNTINNANIPYILKADHIVYNNIVEILPAEFNKALSNKEDFIIKGSLGQTQVASIPWIVIRNEKVSSSAQNGFYVVYLFSRNAKYLYLSIALGVEQFKQRFGERKKTIKIIKDAANKLKSHTKIYNINPSVHYDEMDLYQKEDISFIRDFKHSGMDSVMSYEAGSIFTKKYDLQKEISNEDFNEDFINYIKAYELMINNKVISTYIETYAESIIDDKEITPNYDYELPVFEPKEIISDNQKKKHNISHNSNNGRIKSSGISTKVVGDKGEIYVYQYEYEKLMNIGRKDLAIKIVKQYEDKKNFPGYDIKSYDKAGEEIFIEVKSTKGQTLNNFVLSKNEWDAASKFKEKYFIYTVINALNPGKIKIDNTIPNIHKYEEDNKVLLKINSYQVYYNK